MNSNVSNELVASIPYANGKSIAYYKDRIIFGNKEIFYDDITGYGYLLSTYRHSINYIPVYNSKTVALSVSTGNDKKAVVFSRRVAMPSGFHSKKQADLDIIFSEIVKITNAILAKRILGDLYKRVREGESLNIGGLTIEENSIRRKGAFKEKELEQYGRSYINAGQVVIEDGSGKQFFSISLGTINAPLLAPLLDALFGE